MNSILLNIEGISGIFYPCGKITQNILIYGIGAPTVPDNGDLPESIVVTKKKIDLFVPDSIGFGRSIGRFTPKNSIKTFLKLYDSFTKGTLGINHYSHTKVPMKYNRVIFAGRSLGGAYVPVLPKYNKNIKEIGVIFGALDQSEQGVVKGEETNEDFIDCILMDGYKYLYRGFNEKVWLRHLYDRDGLSPMDNIEFLRGAKVFIAHGKKDKCIHFSKSVAFYKSLITTFQDNKSDYKLRLYGNGGHDSSTAKSALNDFLNWIGV